MYIIYCGQWILTNYFSRWGCWLPTSTLPLIPFIGTLIISISVLVLVLYKTNVHIYRSAVVTMTASPRMLVLLLVALHLQPHYSKYYLVETDGKYASVHKKHMGSPEHIVSSYRTSKTRTRTKTDKALRIKKAHLTFTSFHIQRNQEVIKVQALF